MSDAEIGRTMKIVEETIDRYEDLYNATNILLRRLSSLDDDDYPGLGELRKAIDASKEDFEE